MRQLQVQHGKVWVWPRFPHHGHPSLLNTSDWVSLFWREADRLRRSDFRATFVAFWNKSRYDAQLQRLRGIRRRSPWVGILYPVEPHKPPADWDGRILTISEGKNQTGKKAKLEKRPRKV